LLLRLANRPGIAEKAIISPAGLRAKSIFSPGRTDTEFYYQSGGRTEREVYYQSGYVYV